MAQTIIDARVTVDRLTDENGEHYWHVTVTQTGPNPPYDTLTRDYARGYGTDGVLAHDAAVDLLGIALLGPVPWPTSYDDIADAAAGIPDPFTVDDDDDDDDDETGCQGHPAGPYDVMGVTSYCDGSCEDGREFHSLYSQD